MPKKKSRSSASSNVLTSVSRKPIRPASSVSELSQATGSQKKSHDLELVAPNQSYAVLHIDGTLEIKDYKRFFEWVDKYMQTFPELVVEGVRRVVIHKLPLKDLQDAFGNQIQAQKVS